MKWVFLLAALFVACSSSSTTPSTDAGSGTSTDTDAGPAGETCTGFGTGDPCGANGLPTYGYVCVGGHPPGFTDCVKASDSSLGQTWCCPKNDCVAEPDQDQKCTIAGLPHLFQCPPGATLADGCAKRTLTGSPYDYACCP
jgi:hypothetical protein